MNVLSLFDGMSCGQIALHRAGISYGKYYASEIDQNAITVTQANYPDTIQIGDVTRWREWGIDWSSIDLIMGGSPCQGFSVAGKGLAFDDPRSKLFFTFVDILNHVKSVNPKVKFLLENVKMKKEYLQLITQFMGVEPVSVNSALVSAQHRQRFFWTNWKFSQPADRGLLFKDVLETSVDSKYYHSQNAINYLNRRGANNRNRFDFGFIHQTKSEKACCLVANLHKGLPFNTLVHDRSKPPVLITQLCRKLTPLECERLQTVPEGYTDHVKDKERYRMLGNGWTVDVIAHILSSRGQNDLFEGFWGDDVPFSNQPLERVEQ